MNITVLLITKWPKTLLRSQGKNDCKRVKEKKNFKCLKKIPVK